MKNPSWAFMLAWAVFCGAVTASGQGQIVFVSDRDGNDEIYVMNIDGANPRRLTNHPAVDNDPNWSPDGTKIAFRSDREGGAGIYVMNADGTGVRRLSLVPGMDAQPAWSPDGSQIAFLSYRDHNPEIYVMNADGGQIHRLTDNAGRAGVIHPDTLGVFGFGFDAERAIDMQPAWSPGQRILFWSNRDGDQEIFTMNADGTEQRQITFNAASDGDPTWSPDGTKIAFASNRDDSASVNIFTMNADGSGQAQLTHFKGEYAGDDSWSADGTKIVFEHAQNIQTANPRNKAEVWVMNADGSGQKSLNQSCHAEDCAPRWQPNNLK